MKKFVIPFAALGVGLTAAVTGWYVLRGLAPQASSSILSPNSLISIGEISAISGDVLHRLPGASQPEPLKTGIDLHNQELIITGPKSEAAVSFLNGATLRVGENSRVAAELDATQEHSVMVTILDGTLSVGVPGPKGALRIYKNGREVSFEAARVRGTPIDTKSQAVDLDNVISTESAQVSETALSGSSAPGAEAAASSGESSDSGNSGISASATAPTPAANAGGSEQKQVQNPTNPSSDSLTNDEIARQVGLQSAFFRRCYLSFLNRTQSSTAPSQNLVGKVVAGFTIQSTGRVSGAKLVRSDFKDETLNKCVLETIERTSFKPFNASAISVAEFPVLLQ